MLAPTDPNPQRGRLVDHSSVPFPPGWKLQRSTARTLSGSNRLVDGLDATAASALAATRRAIEDLTNRLGSHYSRGADYLQRLAGLETRLAELRKILSPVSPGGELATLYRAEPGRFIGDLDLDFDGDKLLLSMPGDNGRWQVFELRTDASGLRQPTGEQPDVDSYDACYLPNGRPLRGPARPVRTRLCTFASCRGGWPTWLGQCLA